MFGAALILCSACKPSSQSKDGMDGSMPMNSMGHAGTAAAVPAKLVFQLYKPYPYPFSTCVVCGMPLGADAITFVEGDYQVKVCSAADQEVFRKNPDTYLAKIKQAYSAAKPNPLTTCAVCGMTIDGGFLPFVYEGRQFQVCDTDCLAEFQKDPAKYVKVWDEAAAQAKKQ